MDHLRAMRLFVRIADLGTLTAASTDLGYARGAASATVAELESYLGVQLLERTTRRLRLTEDGIEYLDRARRILAEVEDMEAEIGSAERLPRGRLRVQVPSGIARIFLAPALPEFLDRHPGLSIEVLSRNERPDFVGQGLDCAIYVGELPDSDIIARPLGTLPLITVATPRYLERRGTPQSVDDLARHDCLGFFASRTAEPVKWVYRTPDGNVTFAPESRLTFEAADATLAAMLAHAGIMQLGSHMVFSEVRSGRLVTVLDALRPPGQPAYVLYPRHRHKPRKLRVFEEFVLTLNRDLRRRLKIRDG